jgi:hypothetical protein
MNEAIEVCTVLMRETVDVHRPEGDNITRGGNAAQRCCETPAAVEEEICVVPNSLHMERTVGTIRDNLKLLKCRHVLRPGLPPDNAINRRRSGAD